MYLINLITSRYLFFVDFDSGSLFSLVSAPLWLRPYVIILWFQPHSVSGPILLFFGFSPTLSPALCYCSLVSAPLCLRPYVIILWFQPHSVSAPALCYYSFWVIPVATLKLLYISHRYTITNSIGNSLSLEKYINRVKILKTLFRVYLLGSAPGLWSYFY